MLKRKKSKYSWNYSVLLRMKTDTLSNQFCLLTEEPGSLSKLKHSSETVKRGVGGESILVS